MKRKALYIGSFDPITFGHIDIIERASRMFDEVVVVVGANPKKITMFTEGERILMVITALQARGLKNVLVATGGVKSLAADYAHMNGCQFLIKGARTTQDFDYERLIHEITITQQRNIETVLLFSSTNLSHVSSSAVKELSKFQGLVHDYVPMNVKSALELKNGQVIIGVTGTAGSGKSTLCQKLVEHGFGKIHHVNMDTLSHQLLSDSFPLALIVQEKVLEELGTLDRKSIGNIVFDNSDEGREKLKKFNAILRDPMMTLLRSRLADLKGVILLEGALLAELNWLFMCNNRVILVKTPSWREHLIRLEARGMTTEQIARRVQSQFTYDEKFLFIKNQIEQDKFGCCVDFDSEINGDFTLSKAYDYVQPEKWFKSDSV